MTLLTLNPRQKVQLQEAVKDMRIAGLLLELFEHLPKEEHTDLITEQFNTRTAMQILNDGYATGCTDFAICYCAFLRYLNISYEYIEVLEKRWLESPIDDKKVMGHAFVKVGDLLIDPQRKIIYQDPAFVLRRYEVFGEGKEPYDLGLTSFRTNMRKYLEFKEKYQLSKKTTDRA